jgi:phenylpyruvate tautomerase PptA (4-oxalocrotonate tautomerase family)
MSLHRIYHSPDVFSTANKQELAENITDLYRTIGLPEFYVDVIFVPIEKNSFFVGGQSKDEHIRIVIQHFATQLHSNEIRKTFVQQYEKAISPLIEEKGYDWEVN